MKQKYRKLDEVCEKQFDLVVGNGEMDARPRATKRFSTPKGKEGWNYFSLAGQLGFDIALPMVIGLVIGTNLDDRWGTRPKATLVFLMIGLFFSCTSLIRIVRDASRKR